jgi:hypothetical protein
VTARSDPVVPRPVGVTGDLLAVDHEPQLVRTAVGEIGHPSQRCGRRLGSGPAQMGHAAHFAR